ncbi:bacteriocin immunity protein [Lacticaseibacillus zhaodongensis]|uniref:bacteriocin immunity protein n=1 Tax=Lacticaseibacillus zhaodongensis TaxID=2668065 RepID=UPI0018AF9A1C|nr:bacteriocin immunity protein [Lacticaseibacillus zhaodongensis]
MSKEFTMGKKETELFDLIGAAYDSLPAGTNDELRSMLLGYARSLQNGKDLPTVTMKLSRELNHYLIGNHNLTEEVLALGSVLQHRKQSMFGWGAAGIWFM